MKKPNPRGEVVAEVRCHVCGAWLAYILHREGAFGLQSRREFVRRSHPDFTKPGAPRLPAERTDSAVMLDGLDGITGLQCPKNGWRSVTREQIDRLIARWQGHRSYRAEVLTI